MLAHCQHGRLISRIELILAESYAALRHGVGKRHAIDRRHTFDTCDHALIVRRAELPAVGPKYFDGVIARRIVAGTYHDAAIAVLVATVNDNSGVARKPSNISTLNPLAAMISAQSSAKCRDRWRVSYAIERRAKSLATVGR